CLYFAGAKTTRVVLDVKMSINMLRREGLFREYINTLLAQFKKRRDRKSIKYSQVAGKGHH
ncbi:MAG: hypothetical protein VYE62_07650, partial [Pseudomonadota bacterium]|nr:hypothetical protein [Pseudomonadota bacterium]